MKTAAQIIKILLVSVRHRCTTLGAEFGTGGHVRSAVLAGNPILHLLTTLIAKLRLIW